MAAPDNRVPQTYRISAFIPDGYVDVLGALSIVGETLFSDEWTGEETAARSPAQRLDEGFRRVTDEGIVEIPADAEEQHRREDEARQRRDQVVVWLRQQAYAGKISSKIITKNGIDHDVPKMVWAAENAWQIFDTGTTGFAVGDMYNLATTEGHVLFRERELQSALPASATTANAERKCRKWLADKMRDGGREKTKMEYEAEAKDHFEIGSKAFLRAWANAIVDTGNTDWSKPGRSSIPLDQNPN